MAYDSAFGQFMYNAFGNFDLAILGAFGAVQNDIFTFLAKVFTCFGDNFFVISFGLICCFLFLFKRTRKIAFMLLVAMVLFYFFNSIVFKYMFMRMRPYNVLQGNPEYFNWYMNVGAIQDSPYCFPSGHTCYTVACSTVLFLWLKFDKKSNEAWFVFIIPLFVGLSRIYLMVHYPTDVIFGIVEGVLIAYGSWYLTKFIIKKGSEVKVLVNINHNLDLEIWLSKKIGRQLNLNTFTKIIVLVLICVFVSSFLRFNSSLTSDNKHKCEYSGTDYVCMNEPELEIVDQNSGDIHYYCKQHGNK